MEMFTIIVKLIGAAILAMLVHEGSHYLIARVYKRKISFRLEIARLFKIIPIPRGIWDMPMDITSNAQRNIALAGFTGEFIVVLLLFLINITTTSFAPYYGAVAILHFFLYGSYAGEHSDFKWIINKK